MAAPLRFLAPVDVRAANPGRGTRSRVAGLMLPYGIGATSIGPVEVDGGTVLWLPPHPVPLTAHHDRERPIGVAETIEVAGDGWHATWALADTPDAVEALALVAAGALTGQSVELDAVELVERPNLPPRIASATLVASALVTVPAFPTARAALIPEDSPMEPSTSGTPATAPAAAPSTAATLAAAAPSTLDRAALTASGPRSVRNALTVRDASALIAAAITGRVDPATLTAALSDATTAADGLGPAIPPQWVGNLWEAATTPRPHVEVCAGPKPVEGLKVTGTRVKAPLRVASWPGNKADVPSNVPTREAVEQAVQRWAGGVDVAREIIDLGHADIIADLLAEAVEDYRAKTDAACLAALVAAAKTLPAAASLMAGVIAVTRELRKTRRPVAAVFVATDLLDDELGALAELRWRSGSLGIDGGDPYGIPLRADPDIAAGHVLGVARGAATWYETGPIRVNALDVARGGFDAAVFGYSATLINNPAGIATTTVTPAEPAA